ncbi:cholesterol 24-hydroxylase-like isoform X2 [Antedon mediterranea]|uniref:cholesterol 24-hydroxylase-like isoform X2 n=1 Tax=Antedon mediterranea TaxID=105859 RepID=UPI003AF71B23
MGSFIIRLIVPLAIYIPVLFLAFILIYSLFIVYSRRRYAHFPQPKTFRFFSGHAEYQVVKRVGLIEKWLQQYGNIICLHTYHITRILVLDPAIVKEILTNNEHKKLRYYFLERIFGERFLGRSILTEWDNTLWNLKRKRLNKAFHKSTLQQMVDQFDSCANSFINHLEPMADGKNVIQMVDKLGLVTEDIIAKVGFGLHLDVYKEDGVTFDNALTETFRLKWIHAMPQWFSYPPFGKGLKQRNRSRLACRILRKFGRDCIMKRLENSKNNDETPNDLLHYILQEYTMDESLFSPDWFENIVDEFVTFFVAGNETTSSLLSFTLILLGRHPDVQRKVQLEIDEVIDGKKDIEYHDLLKLKYLSMVFKEVLRIHPPVHSSIRKLSSELTLNGFKFAKGTLVQFPHSLISRLEKYYKNPLEFHPERWTDSKLTESNNFNYQYFPFSAGPRICIGKDFALIEARIITARLIGRFNIRLEKYDVDGVTVGGTTRPKDCLVTLTARQ